MDFALSEDERLLSEALEKLAADHATPPPEPAAYHRSPALEAAIGEAGYLEVCEALGPVGAVLAVEALARTPFAVEAAGRALVAPMALGQTLSAPLAIHDAADPAPVRFLAPGAALLVVRDENVGLVDEVREASAVQSLFAYPYGAAGADLLDAARPLPGVSPEGVRLWRRVGISAEAVGAMRAALRLTAGYVADRKQFGRPIGSYQAVQHRLAECACLVDGAWLMTLKAAASGDEADALLTLAFVQRALGRLVEETNQLHGAIGLTLEYPLHYWSYRMRALQGELGGSARQAALAATRLWAAATVGPEA
jgi:alkylation response protein AidB-like acyl-CoA dehydrogenase